MQRPTSQYSADGCPTTRPIPAARRPTTAGAGQREPPDDSFTDGIAMPAAPHRRQAPEDPITAGDREQEVGDAVRGRIVCRDEEQDWQIRRTNEKLLKACSASARKSSLEVSVIASRFSDSGDEQQADRGWPTAVPIVR